MRYKFIRKKNKLYIEFESELNFLSTSFISEHLSTVEINFNFN